jgi:Fic family protein
MQRTLADFETFLHAKSDLPPLIRLGLVHYQFEAIHPFLDGNGRVGRLLIALLLGAWGLMPQPLLYLSAYFEAHQREYYDHLLAVSQRGAWNEWLVFFFDGVAVQSHDAVQRIQRLQDLRERYRQRVQATRAAARMLQVVDLLFANPLITVSTVQSALKVQFPVAQRYVDQLVMAKVLREITGRARNRVYRAEEILRVIDAPLE